VYYKKQANIRMQEATAAAEGLTDPPPPKITHSNQYPPMMGVPEFRRAVARHSADYDGLLLDPDTQVLATVGASEGLAAVFLGLLNPGDEVILLTPAFDIYAPVIRRAGATPRFVALRPPGWALDPAELEAAFSERTKIVVVNTPHNPTGKVFSREELQVVAGGCLDRHLVHAFKKLHLMSGAQSRWISAPEGLLFAPAF
jgi:N-succinyldiaminopimelate aminotransferase